MTLCKICNTNNRLPEILIVKEMMFGIGQEFEYFQCTYCNCLQIITPPSNIKDFYRQDYYSHNLDPRNYFNGFIKKLIKNIRNYNLIVSDSKVKNVLNTIFPVIDHEFYKVLFRCGLNKQSKILDVGCGTGTIPYILKNAGFQFVIGIDPYLEKDIYYTENDLTICKKDIFKVEDKFDLIMFNHSLEHIFEQHETIKKVSELLNKNGKCLIRIPTVSSIAWEKYKQNWWGIDSPRHFFLHSHKSIQLLCAIYDFKLNHISCDGNEMQFLISEQYSRNISLFNKESIIHGLDNSIFTKNDIEKYKIEAQKLNIGLNSDHVALIFEKQ